MEPEKEKVTALLLAGARTNRDPIAQMAGVMNKVLANVGGEPMLSRVLRTLEMSQSVDRRVLCGPSWDMVQDNPFLLAPIESGKVQWVEPQKGPSLSVGEFLAQHPQELPILITTGDHALLTPEVVDFFIREAQRSRADVAVGLVPYRLVADAYPETKRTVIRFGKEGFCGCNLFAIFSPKAKRLTDFWNDVERERKHPLRLMRNLGVMVMIQYLLGWLSLSASLKRLGQRFDIQIQEILMPFPDAAIDVDTLEDLALVEKILVDRKNEAERLGKVLDG